MCVCVFVWEVSLRTVRGNKQQVSLCNMVSDLDLDLDSVLAFLDLHLGLSPLVLCFTILRWDKTGPSLSSQRLDSGF